MAVGDQTVLRQVDELEQPKAEERRHPSKQKLEERTSQMVEYPIAGSTDSRRRVLPASTTGGRTERNKRGDSPLGGATRSGVWPGSYAQSASFREFLRPAGADQDVIVASAPATDFDCSLCVMGL